MKKTTQAATWSVSVGSLECPECGANAVSTAPAPWRRSVTTFVLKGSRVPTVSVCDAGHQWPAARLTTHRIKGRRLR